MALPTSLINTLETYFRNLLSINFGHFYHFYETYSVALITFIVVLLLSHLIQVVSIQSDSESRNMLSV